MQLALIFDEGNVWHFSISREGPKVKEMLLKLPMSMKYFGYSDDKGILYFFHSDVRKPITKFHKSLSKGGHKTIDKSKRNDMVDMEYDNGLLIGIWFWEFGRFSKFHHFSSDQLSHSQVKPKVFFKTEIWNTKRSVWMNGPHLISKDQEIFSYYTFEELTGTALNRATVSGDGGDVYNSQKETYHRDIVFTVNIQNNVWKKYPNLPISWCNSDCWMYDIKIIAALTFEQRYRFFQR